MSDGCVTGTVTKWFGDKGFGWLNCRSAGRIYVHRDELEGTRNLKTDDTVSFFLVDPDGPDHFPSAESVRLIKRNTKVAHQTQFERVTPRLGETAHGTVCSWNAEKGFGFVSTDDGDVFFHKKKVRDLSIIRDGEVELGTTVKFVLSKGRKPASIEARDVMRDVSPPPVQRERSAEAGGERGRSRSKSRGPPADVQPQSAMPLPDPAHMASLGVMLQALSPAQIQAVMTGGGMAAGAALSA
eukprot:gene6096-14883_t